MTHFIVLGLIILSWIINTVMTARSNAQKKKQAEARKLSAMPPSPATKLAVSPAAPAVMRGPAPPAIPRSYGLNSGPALQRPQPSPLLKSSGRLVFVPKERDTQAVGLIRGMDSEADTKARFQREVRQLEASEASPLDIPLTDTPSTESTRYGFQALQDAVSTKNVEIAPLLNAIILSEVLGPPRARDRR